MVNRSAEDLAAPTTSIKLRLTLLDESGHAVETEAETITHYYIQPSMIYWRSIFNHIVRDKVIKTIEFSYTEWKSDFDINIVRLAKFLDVELTPERRQACKDLLVFR